MERGTHMELLGIQGRYFAMWEKQTKAEKDVANTPSINE